MHKYVSVLVTYSYLTLCDPMDYSLLGSSVRGILQARTLQWVALLSSRGSSRPGIEPAILVSPTLAGGFFTTSATWEAQSVPFSAIKKKLEDILDPQLLS